MIAPFDDGRWSRALAAAIRWHEGQTRKNSGLPYVIHCIEVAANLERLGFDEPVVIAGLLHDVLEDTAMTPDALRESFGGEVFEIVAALSERKRDDTGRPRAWIDRKRDHIRHLRRSGMAIRAVALADQRQNLASVLLDWSDGDTAFWMAFNGSPGDYLTYHRKRLEACAGDEPGIRELAGEVAKLATALQLRLEHAGLADSGKFGDSDWA